MKVEVYLMRIADNIKRIREQYHLTQEDLGKIAGVSNKAVWTWENGTAIPRMGAIQRIADRFGIPKSVIIDCDLDKVMIRPAERRLIDLYQELNEEGQEKVQTYITDLIDSGKYKKHNTDSMVGEA